MVLEKFHNLSVEKKNTIINAAMEAFGSNGYKKASISDIAASAGISKAMVFHYFGTKKDLYFYLLDYSSDLILDEIEAKFDRSVTDFFDRIAMATRIKTEVIKRHPATLSFLYSVFYESNEEVRGGINELLAKSEGIKNTFTFEGLDYSKFKEGVDVALIMKMLAWMSEGFAGPSKGMNISELDAKIEEFNDALGLLRRNLYKEEYL
jgi:TetR/AcrR family transcriptional regulator